MDRYKMYIGGEWCEAASGAWFETENPFTGKVWAEVARGGEADAARAAEAAHEAFISGPWPTFTATQSLLRTRPSVVTACPAPSVAMTPEPPAGWA